MKALRRLLLALIMAPLLAWGLASAALALALPAGWRLGFWPASFPGHAVVAPAGAALRWTPLEPRVLRITGAQLPMPGHPLGRLAALDAELVLEGRLGLPWSLWSSGGLPGLAARWRDDGGRILLRHFALVWGPLRVSGTGELRFTLDAGLLGSFQGRIEGEREAAEMLAAGGLITPAEARAAGLFSGPDAARALFFKDGALVLGTLPVLPLR